MSARFSNMDGWRAFALVLVVLDHLLHFTSVRELWPHRLLFLGDYGVIGLDGFFFISGFVITAGLSSEHRRFGSISLKAFYLRRVMRIFPPLWIFLAVLTVLGLLHVIDHPPLYSLYSAAFLCNFPQPIECGWYAGHTWTLAYEEQFYLLFPMTLVLSLRAGKPAWPAPAALLCAALAMLLTLMHRSEWAGVPRVASFMLAGVACSVDYARLTAWVLRRPSWIFNLALVVLLTFPMWPEGRPVQLAYITLGPLLFIGVLVGGGLHQLRFSRFLARPRMTYFGQISYSIYLWQQLATGFHGQWPPYYYPFSLLAVVGLAMLSYRLLEAPCVVFAADYTRRQHLPQT